MNSISNLYKYTEEFFQLHWIDHLGPRPIWSTVWKFEGEIPNNDKQGCYALLYGEDVLYIGAGAGRGSKRYPNAGIGARLNRCWKTAPSSKSQPLENRIYVRAAGYEEITGSITLGFETGKGYLSYSLEAYLIGILNPPKNRLKPGSKFQ